MKPLLMHLKTGVLPVDPTLEANEKPKRREDEKKTHVDETLRLRVLALRITAFKLFVDNHSETCLHKG